MGVGGVAECSDAGEAKAARAFAGFVGKAVDLVWRAVQENRFRVGGLPVEACVGVGEVGEVKEGRSGAGGERVYCGRVTATDVDAVVCFVEEFCVGVGFVAYRVYFGVAAGAACVNELAVKGCRGCDNDCAGNVVLRVDKKSDAGKYDGCNKKY